MISGFPFNISRKCVSTLAGMLAFIDGLDLKQMHFVMDKGFYSENGIDLLLEKYIKFAVGVPFTTKTARQTLEYRMENICNPRNVIEVDVHIYYAFTQRSKVKGRRVYYHIYLNRERQINFPGLQLIRKHFTKIKQSSLIPELIIPYLHFQIQLNSIRQTSDIIKK